MKWLTFIGLVIAALPVSGQVSAYTFSDPQTYSKSASVPAAFYPANIAGAVLYLSYLDMPTNSTQYNWTNEISIIPSSLVWVNTGTTYPTNSASGIYFPGNTANYFANSTSGILFSNSGVSGAPLCSIWVCFNFWGNVAGSFSAILGDNAAAGWGIFQMPNSVIKSQYGPGRISSDLTLNAVHDYASAGTNGGVVGAWSYLDGSFIGTDNVGAGAGGTLWGIGRDADADTQSKMYLKFVLFCTNYTFTVTDIANLHAYALSH
jgi:hypothetical protein